MEIVQEEQTIVESRELRYEFTDDDLREMGEELSKKVTDYEEKEDEKKAEAKRYNAILKKMMKEMIELSRSMEKGFEEKMIDCKVQYNTPVYGKKRITRQDTDDWWDEEMSYLEQEQYGPNLFNQVVDDFDSSFAEEATVIEESKRLELPSWEEEE